MVFFIPAAGVAAGAAAGGFTGAALLAAASEVAAAMVSYPALIIGGGLTGYAIGKSIWDYLPPETYPVPTFPVPLPAPETPPAGSIRVTYRIQRQSDPLPFLNSVTITAPFGGVGYEYLPDTGGATDYLRIRIFGATGSQADVFLGLERDLKLGPEILAITPLDGQTTTRPSPSQYPRQSPADYAPSWQSSYQPADTPDAIYFHPEVLLQPKTTPLPGGQNSPADILVAVPEAASLFGFSPYGVTVTPYRPNENRVPASFAITGLENTKTTKTSTDECPCKPEINSDEILCRLKEFRKYIVVGDWKYTFSGGGSGGGGEKNTGDDELFAVNIAVTPQISNPKKQEGRGGARDVYYLGWFWFKSREGVGERLPLSALNNEFLAPEGATGYAWTVYSGYTAIASHVTRKRDTPAETC